MTFILLYRNGETVIMQITTTDTESISSIYYIVASVITCLMTIYMLAHFSTFVDGYLYTCKQYRRVLIKDLHLTGTAIEVIQSRLPCNAVYDFMDYLEPITEDIIRDNFINTAAALIAGLVCSFFTFIAILVASIINVMFAKNK